MISAIMGNLSDKNEPVSNLITGKTYFFTMRDTNLKADLSAQLNELVLIAESIIYSEQ